MRTKDAILNELERDKLPYLSDQSLRDWFDGLPAEEQLIIQEYALAKHEAIKPVLEIIGQIMEKMKKSATSIKVKKRN